MLEKKPLVSVLEKLCCDEAIKITCTASGRRTPRGMVEVEGPHIRGRKQAFPVEGAVGKSVMRCVSALAHFAKDASDVDLARQHARKQSVAHMRRPLRGTLNRIGAERQDPSVRPSTLWWGTLPAVIETLPITLVGLRP